VMVVQADGASYAQDPVLVAEALGTISATGRESLAEMRRLLGLLRSGDATDAPGNRPQPGLDDLAALLDQARSSGTRVRADISDLPAVPPGVGLTVYRLVQEALTNVRKHAGPDATATVSVHHDGRAIHVEVADDGCGPAAASTDGHGLLGMRERVATHGGLLAAGAALDGGFLLRATVPTLVPTPEPTTQPGLR
jgi:signal transduction histidine kinase